MICPRLIYMRQVIVGKCPYSFQHILHFKEFRIHAHRAVCRHSKLVPESRLYHIQFKQLAYHLQAIDRLLLGLCREAVHEVGMYHNACFGKAIGHLSHLGYGYAFFDQL
ncbi:hypothetical protein D9M68_700480 [compost metagenome]